MRRPKLLIVELWGLGDLAIATPFLHAAIEKFDITLVAKPHALEMQPYLWPSVRIVPFTAPWTVFKGKYLLWRWPWREMLRLQKRIASEHFDYAVSARWDPRDHFLMKFSGARRRLGFSRLGSRIFLSESLQFPGIHAHRYEFWRIIGKELGVNLPPRRELHPPSRPVFKTILVHTGARLTARVWPLNYYHALVLHLRRSGYSVRVICDVHQREWWLAHGEIDALTPINLSELFELYGKAGAFIGNDSGPGHLAAAIGVPTFTFFGPSLPEWFAPLHPQANWLDDKSCHYKPCKDYCRFSSPRCLENISVESALPHVEKFLTSVLGSDNTKTPTA